MQGDHVVRAITEDGGFRIIAVRDTDTVAEAVQVQGATGQAANLLGDLLTGTVLTRETMAPSLRVQAFLMVDGKGTITSDSHPDGMTRGLVSPETNAELSLTDKALLRVTRALPNHELHEGIVSANSTDHGLSGAFVTYMMQSEQVESTVGLGTSLVDGVVQAAGGFIVQLLPEASPKSVAMMTDHLEQFYDPTTLIAETGGDPKQMIERLLLDIPFVILDESMIHFGCSCSEVRVLSALSALGRDELSDMVAQGKTIETTCDYCRTEYRIAPQRLVSLLREPS